MDIYYKMLEWLFKNDHNLGSSLEWRTKFLEELKNQLIQKEKRELNPMLVGRGFLLNDDIVPAGLKPLQIQEVSPEALWEDLKKTFAEAGKEIEIKPWSLTLNKKDIEKIIKRDKINKFQFINRTLDTIKKLLNEQIK